MTDLLPSTAARLHALVARTQRDGRTPSLVAGVVRGGGLVWSCGRGAVPAGAAHDGVQYRLGSITKPVTAVAVMRLRDEGLLDLDDALEDHLPGTPFGRRTVGQLLAHVGGVGAESPGGWWERTPGGTLEDLALGDADRVLAAGRRFHYSNLGFGLLGQLAARLRGRSWDAVVRDEVLLPLGMARTSTRPSGVAAQGFAVHPWADVLLPEPEHDAGAMAPAGQLWATLADLGRFGAFLLGDTADVLSPATLDEMCEPAGVDASTPGWSAYGLGLQVSRVDGRTLVGHGGSMPGFLAMLTVDREEQTAGVALANSTAGVDLSVAGRMLDVVRSAEPHVVDAWAPAASPVPLDVLGPWYWGPSPLSLRATGEGLLHLSGLGRQGRTSRFRHEGGDRWRGLDGYYAGELLEVGPRELRLATFVFTRTPYDPEADVPGGVDEGGWTA